MRVIAGSARGSRLKTPPRVTRPTADRVKEALFSILNQKVIDAQILDLYSGSGALGIEALSRGAKGTLFIEENSLACQTIQSNLEKCHFSKQASVKCLRVESFLPKCTNCFDLIFADPPYEVENGGATAMQLMQSPHLPNLLKQDGILVLEIAKKVTLTEGENPNWKFLKHKTYGTSSILFYETKIVS